jgi:hypothetical protein
MGVNGAPCHIVLTSSQHKSFIKSSYHHHVAVKELGHFDVIHPEVSSVVFFDFFCLLGCSFLNISV